MIDVKYLVERIEKIVLYLDYQNKCNSNMLHYGCCPLLANAISDLNYCSIELKSGSYNRKIIYLKIKDVITYLEVLNKHLALFGIINFFSNCINDVREVKIRL